MLSLVFQVGDARYALPCKQLQEVVPGVTLRPLVGTPDYVAGMFVFRGEAVPVIDLCRLIAGTPCPDKLSSRIMLARAGTGLIGILAERVIDAIDLVRPVPHDTIPGAAYLGEMFADDSAAGAVVQLLRIDKLLPQTLQDRLLEAR